MPNYLVQQKTKTQNSRAWFLEFQNIEYCLTLENTSETPKRYSIILNKREIVFQHDRVLFPELPNIEYRLRFKGFLENVSEISKESSIVLKKTGNHNSTRQSTIPELSNTEYCLRFGRFLIKASENLKEYSIILNKREIITQHDRAWFSNYQTPGIAFVLKDF